MVEDELNNASVLSQWIASHGHDVMTVHTGANALQICSTRRFHVILLDIHLPDMSGIEVLRQLRQITYGDECQEQCLIAAFTASLMPKDKQFYLQQGFDAVLSKPIQHQEFKQLLHSSLQVSSFEPSNAFQHAGNGHISTVGKPAYDGTEISEATKHICHSEGLLNCDGDEQFYQHLLMRFVEQYQTVPAPPHFHNFVHKLSTGAELIGALPLARLAAELAADSVQSTPAKYSIRKTDLISQLGDVINEAKKLYSIEADES